MKKLINGILEFRKKSLNKYKKKFAHLASGQSPDALFIACCDSRVVPNLMVSTDPGDLFVIRNIGNLVPPYIENNNITNSEAAAIEFSVTQLSISDIIVCGHSECGAMKSILNGIDNIKCPNVKSWLSNCKCNVNEIKDNKNLSRLNQLSQINILQQIEHLLTYPIIKKKVQNKELNIHGWYFDIATGDIYTYNEKLKKYILIT
jgi:carbonic anhydrase